MLTNRRQTHTESEVLEYYGKSLFSEDQRLKIIIYLNFDQQFYVKLQIFRNHEASSLKVTTNRAETIIDKRHYVKISIFMNKLQRHVESGRRHEIFLHRQTFINKQKVAKAPPALINSDKYYLVPIRVHSPAGTRSIHKCWHRWPI